MGALPAGWEELPKAQSCSDLALAFSSFYPGGRETLDAGGGWELPEPPVWTHPGGAGSGGWERGALQQELSLCPGSPTRLSVSKRCCI